MNGLEILALIAAPFALLAIAVLAASETALTRLSRTRVEALPDDAEHQPVLREMVDDRLRALAPLWSVSGLVTLAVAAVAAAVAAARWPTWSVFAAVAIVWLVTGFVTSAARTAAISNLDTITQRVAIPVGQFVMRAPIAWLGSLLGLFAGSRGDDADEEADLEGVSESDLLALTELAAEDQAIDADEQELIESSLAFGDTTARQVMVPRPDMVTVSSEMPARDVLGLVVEHGFSRFPVTGEGIDDVVGVVHAKDVMAALLAEGDEPPAGALMRECRVVPETKQIAKLLREMQSESFQIAVVIDEYGGTAGMCTLEDLIEEIVGEITDEFDVEEPLIESLDAGAVRVNGKATLDALHDLLGARLPEGEWSTVGGLIFNSLGHVPERGETLLVEEHRLTVEAVAGSRIARVLIEPINGAAFHAADSSKESA